MLISAIAAVAAFSAVSSAASIPAVQRPWDQRILLVQRAQMAEEVKASAQSLRPFATTLKPLNPEAFESAFGLEKRDHTDFEHITPGSQAHLVYGTPGMQGQMHFANMTLHASQDLPIVMMERFDHLMSSVDCHGDHGSMSLHFKSREAYGKARSSWKYINEATDRQFLLIANHESCGSVEQRQAYRIHNVDNDDADNSVHLSATPAAWKEVAGTFDLNFGKAALTDEALNSLVSRDEHDETVDISFDHGAPNEPHKIFEDYTTNPPTLKLTCTNCYTTGSFETTGTINVEDFDLKEASLEVLPHDISAELELKTEIAQKTADADWTHIEKTLYETAIPGAGIDIPGIFSLGAKFEFNLQARMLMFGTATLYLGGRMTLDEGARVTVDLANWNRTAATGVHARWEPQFDLGAASITAVALAGPAPALVLGIEVLEEASLEATLSFGVPTFSLNATAGYDQAGWCGPDDPVTSGFKAVSAANFDMSLAIKGDLPGHDETSFFDRKLVNIPLATFLDKCWDVPGLTPPNSGNSSANAAFRPRGLPGRAVPVHRRL